MTSEYRVLLIYRVVGYRKEYHYSLDIKYNYKITIDLIDDFENYCRDFLKHNINKDINYCRILNWSRFDD